MNGESEYQDIRAQQIDNILETNQRKLAEWISNNPKVSRLKKEVYGKYDVMLGI